MSKPKMILGVDPGLKGGLALVSKQGVVGHWRMPILAKGMDFTELNNILLQCTQHTSDLEIILERPQARPGLHAVALGTAHWNAGSLYGFFLAHQIPLELANAATWSKWCHSVLQTKADNSKQNTLAAARTFYPKDPFLFSCKAPHDGIVDAIMIASWGLRHG